MTGRTRPRFEHAAWGVVTVMIVVSSWCTGMPISEERTRRALIGDNVQRYLMDFGYLPQSDLETGNLRSHEQLRDAIKTLQTFGNIPATGELDETTRELMKKPRCGLPDIASNHFRSKRYTLHGQKWHYSNLTWSLRTMYIPGLDPNMVRGVLYRALDVWAQHSKLTFQEINDDRADILVFFERRYHGDGYPFDGPGQILAHAFFPGSGRGGDAHFDLEENWLLHHPIDSSEGTSLFAVAAHEFGHSLGLSHSSVPGALMFPWYQGIKPNFQLPDDDRHGIQQLYGVKERQWAEIPEYPPRPRPTHRPHHEHTPPPPPPTQPPPPPPPPPTPRRPRPPPQVPTTTTTTPRTYPAYPEQPTKPTKKPHRKKPGKPDTCDTSYDAISVIRGETFIFKGRYFWRIGNRGLVPGYPVETDRMWYNLPKNFTHVDAVYERSDKKIVFFIGKMYYLYSGNQLEPGYPKPLWDLGLPETLDKVDGAMVWGHNGKTYFFSGTMYWKFDEEVGKVELDYPRDMSMWNGVGYNIDAVFQWKDAKTYFFKGKGFWKFNDLRMRVENDRQTLSAPFWMGCPRELESRDEKTLEAPLNEEPSLELPPESGSATVTISLLTLLISAISWMA